MSISPWAWGRMWSTSAWGRGMTWTEISSPTFSAAAAPGVGGRLYRAHVAPHHDGHQAAAHLLLAHQLHVGGFHHGVGRLNSAHQSLCLHHTQCVCIGHITVPPVSRLFGLFRFRLRLRWGRRLWFLRFSRPAAFLSGAAVLRRVAAGARPLWAGAARAADTGVCGTPPTAPAGLAVAGVYGVGLIVLHSLRLLCRQGVGQGLHLLQ